MIRSQGYEIYPKDKVRLEKLPVFIVATMLWGLSRISAFRSLLATGKTECSALVDDMLASPPPAAPSSGLHAIRVMKPE